MDICMAWMSARHAEVCSGGIMKTRLVNVWEEVHASFWFVPGVLVLLATGLAIGMMRLDRAVDVGFFGVLYTGGADGAREILSTIAGSMITVAGVAFSITIVALTLASSQYGPHLLRSFMRDTGNQVVLGTFVATFIYCVLVLRSIHESGGQEFVPRLSLFCAIALAFFNVGIFIYFIHHVSTSIQADHVIASVYRDLFGQMKRAFPEARAAGEEDEGRRRDEKDRYALSEQIAATESGYLQAIDGGTLMKIARENDLVIHVGYRPGQYVVAGSALVTVRYNERPAEETTRRIARCFIVGRQRTPEQDPEHSIRQLVEVAIRALSPGINDPFTAMTSVDRLASALCFLAGRRFPTRYGYDEEGRLRVVAEQVTFAGMTNAAYDQIRQYGRHSVSVTIRLLEALERVAEQTVDAEQRQAVRRQAAMIERASREAVPEEHDRRDVRQRYEAVFEELMRRRDGG